MIANPQIQVSALEVSPEMPAKGIQRRIDKMNYRLTGEGFAATLRLRCFFFAGAAGFSGSPSRHSCAPFFFGGGLYCMERASRSHRSNVPVPALDREMRGECGRFSETCNVRTQSRVHGPDLYLSLRCPCPMSERQRRYERKTKARMC